MEAFALPEHAAAAPAAAVTLPPLVHKRGRDAASPASPKRRKLAASPPGATASRPNMTASSSITLAMLRPHFEEPLAHVAARFGICVTLLKKICRRHGISRWPHRQITGLRKSIASMEHAIGYFEGERRASYAQQLRKQQHKLQALLEDPTAANPMLATDEQDAAYSQQAAAKTATSPRGAVTDRPAVHERPQAPERRAASPTGPMLPASPYYTAAAGSLGSPSPMLLPAPHPSEPSVVQQYQQLCPPLYSRSNGSGSGSGGLLASRTNSYAPQIHLPPLHRESRPLLPPIASLVAGAAPSASTW